MKKFFLVLAISLSQSFFYTYALSQGMNALSLVQRSEIKRQEFIDKNKLVFTLDEAGIFWIEMHSVHHRNRSCIYMIDQVVKCGLEKDHSHFYHSEGQLNLKPVLADVSSLPLHPATKALIEFIQNQIRRLKFGVEGFKFRFVIVYGENGDKYFKCEIKIRHELRGAEDLVRISNPKRRCS